MRGILLVTKGSSARTGNIPHTARGEHESLLLLLFSVKGRPNRCGVWYIEAWKT